MLSCMNHPCSLYPPISLFLCVTSFVKKLWHLSRLSTARLTAYHYHTVLTDSLHNLLLLRQDRQCKTGFLERRKYTLNKREGKQHLDISWSIDRDIDCRNAYNLLLFRQRKMNFLEMRRKNTLVKEKETKPGCQPVH